MKSQFLIVIKKNTGHAGTSVFKKIRDKIKYSLEEDKKCFADRRKNPKEQRRLSKNL